eukprot:1158780-Pelagomonas_calceolata.AAC.14
MARCKNHYIEDPGFFPALDGMPAVSALSAVELLGGHYNWNELINNSIRSLCTPDFHLRWPSTLIVLKL